VIPEYEVFILGEGDFRHFRFVTEGIGHIGFVQMATVKQNPSASNCHPIARNPDHPLYVGDALILGEPKNHDIAAVDLTDAHLKEEFVDKDALLIFD
jgi:hypothetical protein